MAVPSRAMFAYSTFPAAGDVELVLNSGSTVLNAVDSGWYSAAGDHFASNPNYIAGLCGATPDPCDNLVDQVYNDFFVFDLGKEPNVTSAVLRVWNPSTGYISSSPSELYKLYDVATNVSDLMLDASGETGIFDDLGSGTLFGSRVVSAGDEGAFVEITLNADAIDALNHARGNWAIGGTLDLGEPVPEPTTLLLLGSGLIAGGRLRRRR
jgi:hypothetical protein